MTETPNERWNRILGELIHIAHDPDETPARRRKASRAYDNAIRSSATTSFMAAISLPLRPRVDGNHRGGRFLQTTIDYQGRREE